MTKKVIHRLPITRARIHLGQVVRRAHFHGEYFILEKDGIPVAAIMSMDDLEDYLELQNPKLRRQIAKGYQEYRRGKGRDVREFLASIRRSARKSAA